MIENALTGSKKYYNWILLLLVIIGMGIYSYSQQLTLGLGITGMSRDVSWGLYIAQFTFLVGVAASAVMLVLPYYIHNYKEFGRIVILGEFLAISAVAMCMLFILVDMGKAMRVRNRFLYITPGSVLFWDATVLTGYLVLNVICGWQALNAEAKGTAPPKWVKLFIYISIPWAVSIHTVTAFLYAGLPGRHYWLTAILAPRFLASAFAAGPALLVILAILVKRLTGFDAGEKAMKKLVTIITYAAIINFFFVLLEVFTAFYSNIPSHMHAIQYLFSGLHGHSALVPWMWISVILGIGAIIMLFVPSQREKEGTLLYICTALFISLWIDKGIGLVLGGFVPTPMEHVVEYSPTFHEISIVLGIWAIGFLILTVLYKTALSIKIRNEFS